MMNTITSTAITMLIVLLALMALGIWRTPKKTEQEIMHEDLAKIASTVL